MSKNGHNTVEKLLEFDRRSIFKNNNIILIKLNNDFVLDFQISVTNFGLNSYFLHF